MSKTNTTPPMEQPRMSASVVSTAASVESETGRIELVVYFHIIIIIIKLYCNFKHVLHVKLECSLALTHIVSIYTIK